MHICAFQQAMHPAALRRVRPAAQEDALALQTQDECHVQQTPLGRWACTTGNTPGNFAWLSVADGVSSSPCADLASRSFLQVLHRANPTPPLQARQLPSLVRQARFDWLAQHLTPRTRGAACTLASLLYADGQVCAVNSGDARIWRLRAQADGSVQWLQISRDHTAWQQMLDEGEVQPEDASSYASVYQGLTQCLVLGDSMDDNSYGEDPDEDHPVPEPWLHIWQGNCRPGDCYLLATDGLHGTLPTAHLQALWHADRPAPDNLAALHAAWRKAGAADDISVVALCLAA